MTLFLMLMIYLNDRVDQLDIEDALSRVSPQRREQALRFRFESGRRLCLAVYLLLMDSLREEYGLDEPPVFDYSPEGKPFIPAHPDIHFSFSHSGNVALCAICDRPVGADVEVPRKISPSLIRYTMNHDEQAQISVSENPTMQFLHFWTRKEALLKLTAEGIRNDMKTVLAEADKYQIETVQTDRYIFSVATFQNIPEKHHSRE